MRASQNMPSFPRKDVKEAANWLLSLGFVYGGYTSGHPYFDHPEYGRMELPSTPSRSWQDVWRSKLAKKMGVSKTELEIKLGLREKKNPNARKRERNVAGVEARKFQNGFVAETKEDVKPSEEKASLADQIKEANSRLDYLPVGSWLYKSVRRELARLRVEYMDQEEGEPA